MSSFSPGPFGAAQRQPLAYESPADAMTIGHFFNAVYAWMAAGLALTGVVAYLVSQQLLPIPMNLEVFIGLFVAELVLVVTISSAINRISPIAATALFLLYAALNGVMLSVIFWVYTRASLGSVFFITAGTFAATSVYGYTTKRDLSRYGHLLFMALIGIVIATLVNIFWHNPIFYWAVSYLGVFLFIGLTAYDTQKLRTIAAQTGNNPRMAARLAIIGSLNLYLDFINLFLFLLRIMGDRKQ